VADSKIEITGARFRDAPGRASLSGAELARVPGSGGDPMRALQALPGVASVDDSSSEPAVRGARPGDNAYYVDFLPVGYLFHLGGFTSVLNPALIRRFSLSSAAWGPEYGNVVGAVFDIELRNPRQDRLGGQIDFSLLGANVLFEGPLGSDMSFFLAARRSWFDLVAKSGSDDDEGVTFTVPVYSDTQGRFLWTLNPNNRLRLDWQTAADRLDFEVKAGGKAAARDPVLVGSSNERQSFTGGALVWETDFGDTASNRVALGRMNQRFSLRFGGAGTVKVGLATSYLRQQFTTTAWRGHEITLGGMLQSRLVDAALDFNFPRCTEFDPNCDISTAPRVVSQQRARQNEAAVHVSDRLQLAPRWAATVGLRLSRDAYLDRNTAEPRFALEHTPFSDLTLSAATGRHSQPPAGEESLAVIGNPRLRPIRSHHAVVGAALVLPRGWSTRLEVYRKSFGDYAVNDPVLNYVNGARGSARGVELLVKKDPSSGTRLSGFASLSLSRSQRIVNATGERFASNVDQPVIATVVAAWKHNERWSYGAKWSYHSGSPFTPVVGTGLYPDGRVRPLYGATNSERVPAYHRLDLRVDWSISRNLSAYAELVNAYNRQNVAGYSYSADYRTREEIRQLGILPSVGVRWGF
jgi:outer membrane receptor for ferrienterochelin and colicin